MHGIIAAGPQRLQSLLTTNSFDLIQAYVANVGLPLPAVDAADFDVCLRLLLDCSA